MASSFYRPQLARLVKQAPEGDDWLHEMKYDGYRIGCRVRGQSATLVTRTGKNWSSAFPAVAEAAAALATRDAILDGEVAVVMPDGRTSFQALQNAFGGGSTRGLRYFVFDLLSLDGVDLRRQPLDARKAALAGLIGKTRRASVIQFADHVAGHGAEPGSAPRQTRTGGDAGTCHGGGRGAQAIQRPAALTGCETPRTQVGYWTCRQRLPNRTDG